MPMYQTANKFPRNWQVLLGTMSLWHVFTFQESYISFVWGIRIFSTFLSVHHGKVIPYLIRNRSLLHLSSMSNLRLPKLLSLLELAISLLLSVSMWEPQRVPYMCPLHTLSPSSPIPIPFVWAGGPQSHG